MEFGSLLIRWVELHYRSSSGEAFSLRVTCEVEEGVSNGMEWRGYVEGGQKRVRTYVVHRHCEE